MEISDEHVKISIFLKDKDNLLANATVSLETTAYGFVTIKDFQIWKSKNMNQQLQEYINIQPPSRNVWGKYILRAFFEDIESWNKLKERIYSAYNLARIKNQNKEGSNSNYGR